LLDEIVICLLGIGAEFYPIKKRLQLGFDSGLCINEMVPSLVSIIEGVTDKENSLNKMGFLVIILDLPYRFGVMFFGFRHG
jgi:hypothetical protein